MFSRNNDKSAPQPERNSVSPASAASSNRGGSFIARDLIITGDGMQMVAEQPLLIEGEIHGSVTGMEVTVGQTGQITGLVHAKVVRVDGRVDGVVRGADVILTSTAQVSGDIHHQRLTLDMGANFEGNSRQAKNESEVIPNLAGASSNTR